MQKKEKIQEEFLFTVLLTNHKKDIYQRTREFVPKYEIKQAKYNPQVYKEVCRVGKMFTDTTTSLFCEKIDATANIGELPFDQMLKRVAAL